VEKVIGPFTTSSAGAGALELIVDLGEGEPAGTRPS
jgi:hypothetical protein